MRQGKDVLLIVSNRRQESDTWFDLRYWTTCLVADALLLNW